VFILAVMPKDPRILPNGRKTIAVLAFPAFQLLDVAGPLQVFSTANEQMQKRGLAAPYGLVVIAPGGGAVRATAGLELAAEPLTEAGTPIDTLVVAGGQGLLEAANDHRLAAWVAGRAANTRRVASVCTGAFLLAAAGLLAGRRAVTHWDYCDRLARLYPNIQVDPDPIFIRDGPYWTSAGVTAGIDLALALVEQDLGRDVALAVARDLVVFLKRPGGQAQYSAALSLQSTDDRFASLHDWMSDNLAGDLSVHRLAARAGMSQRSFMRHYTKATGLTPARAVERLRTETARQLLAETRLSIKRIADRCGFGSEETMRRSFHRLQSITPQEYRQRFSA
jgi:transcriptional regulator GlxA family with amidase domain